MTIPNTHVPLLEISDTLPIDTNDTLHTISHTTTEYNSKLTNNSNTQSTNPHTQIDLEGPSTTDYQNQL